MPLPPWGDAALLQIAIRVLALIRQRPVQLQLLRDGDSVKSGP